MCGNNKSIHGATHHLDKKPQSPANNPWLPGGDKYDQCLSDETTDSPRGQMPVQQWLQEWERKWGAKSGEKNADSNATSCLALYLALLMCLSRIA